MKKNASTTEKLFELEQKNLLRNIQMIIMAGSLAVSSNIVAADSFTDALTGGKANVDINLRYESVDQDETDNASAFTVRTRVGYETADFHRLRAFVEYSGNQSIGDRQDYHVAVGSDADSNNKAVIPDPVISRLNQAWVNYDISKSSVKGGKQRIIMDHRFLGNVGWRQTEQVYTGARAIVKEFSAVKADYSYIMESDNIFGIQTPMQTHALKLDVTAIPFAKVTGYGYLIDVDDSTADSQTLGLKITGAPKVSDSLSLIYHVEYADQSDYADAEDIGGDYYHAKLGAKFMGVTALAAQEKLGGDGSSAFQTPLATKHLFNGWADKFLTTPNDGLVDSYAQVSGKLSGYKLAAVYHDFQSDKGSSHYGTEVDLLVAKKFAKIYTVGVKYASYDADKFATDTSKFWVWGNIKF